MAGALPASCGGRNAIAPGGGGGEQGTGGAVISDGTAGTGGSRSSGAGGAPSTGGAGGGYGGYPDGGFVPDFTARAAAVLAAGAPSWVCATALPTVPVSDTASMRDAVRQYIAEVVGVPPANIMMTVQMCGAAMPANSCAVTFAHDCAKSGGNIYNTVAPLADELNATATAVEETIWVPMQNGISFAGDVVMSGISDGLLVGMVDFNYSSTCP
jgi:hypothetical protein